ncbi:MAG: FRG domain-containing protein [Candidatus Cloacimonetes bacterium]|nr:FRG domain-containing protein [Candidatus Cloacimonadota bacterium]
MENIVRTNGWNDLQDKLFEDSWNPDLGRFRSRFAFRGLSDEKFKLETTLMRLGGDYSRLEHHLLRNFSKYAHQDVVEKDSIWHWLSVAQHHGLPTRLLDWTYSPLVAMHFATENVDKYDMDGVIWAVDYLKIHEKLPERLKKELNTEGANVFTVKMLLNHVETFADLSELACEGDFFLFMEPPSIDDRFINQFAFFSLSSQPSLALDDWLNDMKDCWRKIIIPAELKWEIRDKLDQANITERVLFPGLDGLSSWLKRQYCPRTR